MKDNKLHTIILKVLNRYDISKYETFDEIITTDSNEVSWSIDEIEYVKKDPKVYNNFLKICELVDVKLQLRNSTKVTIESILLDLDMSMYGNHSSNTGHSEICGTIEEILVSMDLKELDKSI